jgi:hypothetical protein
MQPPKMPAEGEPITEVWGRDLLAYVRSLLPLQSNTIRTTRTPSGTLYETTGSRRSRAVYEQTDMAPWTVYPAPGSTWNTVRVHAGKINDLHPVKWGTNSRSDDTATNATDMDMALDAGKTYFIVAVQTRRTASGEGYNAWDIHRTYLFFTDDAPAFPGAAAPEGDDVPDIFRNAYYRTVAKVVVGSDDEEAEDYQQLTITQVLDADLVTSFAPPGYWEPVVTADDPDNVGDDEWITPWVPSLGVVTWGFTLPEFSAFTAGADATYLIYLKLSLDADTGAVTSAEVVCDTEVETPDEPAPGQAPDFCTITLATITFPSNVGKAQSAVGAGGALAYDVVCAGFGVDEDGVVVALLRGFVRSWA